MSLLRFFLSYNRIPLILFSLFGLFFNLFYNTNILGVKENINLVHRLDPFDKHGNVSQHWFHNTMTLVNCFMGCCMAICHTMSMSSILFNAKYRVVSCLVHLVRIRNIICPLITITTELILFRDNHKSNMNHFQSKFLHQSYAQLVPTILYGLAAILLYSNYDRYLMEIRLIFDYLTLSLRCTRGLSPLEEQTYICEAINLHACRETMVLDQREKADRELKEQLRREQERIRRDQMERTRADEQRLQRVQYVNHWWPTMIAFLRNVFGLQKVMVDEENIPPSIRTGIEKQKDELRICAAKTMCCNIQRHFKDKHSILPNCLQGISRAKINLCDLKGDKDLCKKNDCLKSAQQQQQAKSSGGGFNYFKPLLNSSKKETGPTKPPQDSNNNSISECMVECKQKDDVRMNEKRKKEERDRKLREKSERELRERHCREEREERKRRQKESEECEENTGAVSIFNDLPRTDLAMNCEIKRVLDPDCQEVLRCKEVIVPPPISAQAANALKNCGGNAVNNQRTGPRDTPVGQHFGMVSNCNRMGMVERMQPIYQCANSAMNAGKASTCNTTTTGSGSCSTCQTGSGSCSSTGQTTTDSCSTARGRQMDGMTQSVATPSTQISSIQASQSQNGNGNVNLGGGNCNRMGGGSGCGNVGPPYVQSRPPQSQNKTSVRAIPVQVTVTDTFSDNSLGGMCNRLANNINPNAANTTPLNNPNMYSLDGRARQVSLMSPQSMFPNVNMESRSRQNAMASSTMPMGFNNNNNNNANNLRQNNCCLLKKQNQQPANPFSSTGAATPIEAQNRRGGGSGSGCDYCPTTIPEDNQSNRTMAGKMHPCIKCASVKCSNSSTCGDSCNYLKKNNDEQPHINSGQNYNTRCDSLNRRRNCDKLLCQMKEQCANRRCDNLNRSSSPQRCHSPNGSGCNQKGRCRLMGGGEEVEPPKNSEKVSATVNHPPKTLRKVDEVKETSKEPSKVTKNNNSNKLTETKREVMKTVTNIDDPSGKVIRKECDTVIEEILQSSAVQPGETKTMREVTVQKNTIHEANKTIREESHNTREEIINFELGHDVHGKLHPLESATGEFENRRQRLDMMRRMSRSPDNKRCVSEERCIYGRFRGGPDLAEVQSEARDLNRSRIDSHRMGGGLKGGTEKRGQSELSMKASPSEEKLGQRSQSMGAAAERNNGRGDFCREFNEHLETSPSGQRIRELKSQLVKLGTPDEMHKTLEQIVLLQTEALMSFVPSAGLKYPRKQFDADLSYVALMRELKAVLKQGNTNDSTTVTSTLRDMDTINEEIERDMKLKMGAQQYKGSQKGEKNIPNHFAFAAQIRELRDKIKDYDDGVVSRTSDEEGETQEQRRQRIEVLRDELKKRKQMLGLESKKKQGGVKETVNNSERIREMKEGVKNEKQKDLPKRIPSLKQNIPKDQPAKRLPVHYVEETIYMDPNGVISNSSIGDSDSVFSAQSSSAKEEKVKSSVSKPRKPRNKNVVAFSDEVKQMTVMPEKTNVKQIAQSLSHLIDMMSRARMAKQPKISLTITPKTRRTNLSQESDVTAVDAQQEASKKKIKLAGGSRPKTIPKTPSNMKLNRAKSFDNLTNKRQPIKQINCRLGSNSNMAQTQGNPMDNRTKQLLSEYLKSRAQNIRTHSSILKGNNVQTPQMRSRATSTPAGPI